MCKNKLRPFPSSTSKALAASKRNPVCPSMRQRLAERAPLPPPPPSSPASSNPSSPALGGLGKAKPPPPKPKPSRLSGAPQAETVTALYDYAAAQEGDLSFKAGDVIEIISRTQNPNEWWSGKLQGRQGQFPGEPPN